MIQVRNLTRAYRHVVALSNVSFTVSPGEIVALLGGNGAGKSTLLRCLLGLSPYDGTLRVQGLDPKTRGRDVRRRIGYLPQSPGLHLDLTGEETLRLYAGLRKVPAEPGRRWARELGLGGVLDLPVGELSGGMRQRLGFALSLLGDPPVLLLDEPSAGLDAGSRSLLIETLDRLAQEDKTILLCTHARHELLPVAHRCLELDGGRLVTPTAPLPARDAAATSRAVPEGDPS